LIVSDNAPGVHAQDVEQPDLLSYAMAALEADIAVLPPTADGTKRPAPEGWVDNAGKPIIDPVTGKRGYGWKHRENVRAKAADLRRWYGSGKRTGFGIACGAVSATLQPLPDGLIGPPTVLGLEMVEFEQRERWDTFVDLAHQIGHGPLVDRIADGYLSSTPGGGVHTLIRCSEYEGNLKLAMRPATDEELAAKPSEKSKVIAETRGQGGFTVEPPSHGTVHLSGKPYTLLRGGLASIVTLTPDERRFLLDLIGSFNELPDEEKPPRPPETPGPRVLDDEDTFTVTAGPSDGATGLDVIAAYNERTTWDELLTRNGWRRAGGTPAGVSFWKHPSKTDVGHSASLNYGGSNKLCVFSTTPNLKVTTTRGSKAGYDQFGFFTEAEHHGDKKAAVRAASGLLGMQGRVNGTSSVHRGTSSVHSSVPKNGGLPEGEWGSSVSSVSSVQEKPPAPMFPLASLPEPARSYVEAGAKSLGAPVGLVATPMLVFAGSTIGNEQCIELKPGYRQRPTLYAAAVAPPGSVKTPSIDFARYPLDVLQTEAHEHFKVKMEQYERDVTDWESLSKADKRGVSKPVKPSMEHYFTTNSTTEALVSMLGNNRGLSVSHDEMTSWVHQMNAYRGGKGGDRQAYLSQWAGSPLKIDRKGQDTQYVPHPVAGVVGGVQPELLPDLADEGGRRDGFVERILWDYPECRPARWTDDTVDETTQKAMVDLFRKLRASTADRPIRLSNDARVLWRSWHDDNALTIEGAHGVTAGIYAKLPNQLARIALILHCMTYPETPANRLLTEDTLTDAIELVEYYRQMANRVVVHFNAQPSTGTAGLTSRIGAFLRRRGDWVKNSEVNKHLGGNFRSKEIADCLVDLEDRDLIEIHHAAPTVGRPATLLRWRNTSTEETEERNKSTSVSGRPPAETYGRTNGRTTEEVAEGGNTPENAPSEPPPPVSSVWRCTHCRALERNGDQCGGCGRAA